MLPLRADGETPARAAGVKRGLEPADLFRVERVGTGSFSPDGRFFVYERTRAAGTGPVRRLSGYEQVRKDLWLVALGSEGGAGEPYNLTGGEESGTGAWHPVWAPDGRHLAFLQIREGRIRAQVWNAHTGTIRPLTDRGIVSLYGSETPLFWLNPSLIACLTWPEGSDEPGRLRAETRPGENATRLWPKAWSGSDVTAAAFESGTESIGDGESRRCHLRIVDLENQTQRIRGEGALSALTPSADGRYLACFDLPCPVPQPRPGPLPRGMLSWMLPVLRVFETNGERPAWDPALPGIADAESLRWSSSGAALALRCRPPDSPDGWPSILCRVLPETREVQILCREGLDIHDFCWCGEVLLVTASSPSAGGDSRLEQWQISAQGAWLNVTAVSEDPPRLVGELPGGSGLVAAAGGCLWQIAPANPQPRDITPGGLSPIARVLWPREHAPGLSRSVIAEGASQNGRTEASGKPQIAAVDLLSGSVRPIHCPSEGAQAAAVSPDGDHVAFVQHDMSGARLWLVKAGEDPSKAQVLMSGNDWLSEIETGEWRPIDYQGPEGEELRGWLLLPPHYEEGQRIPLVTYVYPGERPRASEGKITRAPSPHFVDLQLFVSPGYALLYPAMPLAPEGQPSDPYAVLSHGVIPAVEKVIEMGIAIADRVALAGHSYGGYGVYGLVTQTSRFRCAIAMSGIVNLLSFYGSMDARMRYGDFADPQSSVYDSTAYTEMGQGRMGRPPWEDPESYVRNSPITAVERVTTPLLMIHGDGDMIPLQQAEEFYAALYRQNKRACLVRYAGEGHLIEGQANVLDVWRRIYGWLAEFLDSPVESDSAPIALL